MLDPTWGLNGLRSAVKDAETATLLMSRRHCHAKNVSSIVVAKEGDRLLRAFLAWPGHRLHTNWIGNAMSVGIHDHRYSLDLKAIAGVVRNTVYEESDTGGELYKSIFRTGLHNGTPIVTLVGMQHIRIVREKYLKHDHWLHLEATDLHNIDCDGETAWWVREGETVQTETRLFTAQERVACDGLYGEFGSREEVIEHVEEFMNIWPF